MRSRSATNSSRNRRRRLFLLREYAREQRALHHLGQVDDREHGLVEIGEVRPEDGLLVGAELLDRVHAQLCRLRPLGRCRPANPVPREGAWRWYRRAAVRWWRVRGTGGSGDEHERPGQRLDVHRRRCPPQTPGAPSTSAVQSARSRSSISMRRPRPGGCLGCGTCVPVRTRAAQRRTLAPRHRVHLHLEPAVAGMAPRDHVGVRGGTGRSRRRSRSRDRRARPDRPRSRAPAPSASASRCGPVRCRAPPCSRRLHRSAAVPPTSMASHGRSYGGDPSSRPAPTLTRGEVGVRATVATPAGAAEHPASVRARSRARDTASASARSSPATVRSAGPAEGSPHGSPLPDAGHAAGAGRRDARRRHDAAVARVGRLSGPRAGVLVGCDVADLAEEVDALLDVAHEVAAGHLVVVEHVGERLAVGPLGRRTA